MLNYTHLFRMVWIRGRFGGGKTALAVAVCLWLVQKSYARYIASNIALTVGREVAVVSAEELRRVSCAGPVFRDTVILMDESWQALGKGTSRNQIQSWLSFMRKGNNFLIMPSVLPLVSDVTTLQVERFFNGLVLGVPAWLYKWHLGDYRKGGDRGLHLFMNPKRVFGLYDTAAIPSEEYTIYDTWKEEGTVDN